MAPPSNENPASAGTSSNPPTIIFTPPSSSGSHASAAGSNYTTATDQPAEPSYQLLAYQAQSAAQDSSPYGRLVSQPATGDLAGRIADSTARAQDTTDRFDRQYQPRQA